MSIYQRFYHNNENYGINFMFCGKENCPKGYSFGPAKREHYLFHYVTKGSGTFISDGKEYTVNAGDGFIIFPGETATYFTNETSPWTYLWIGFEGYDCERILTHCGLNKESHLYRAKPGDQLDEVMNRIIETSKTQEELFLQQLSNLYLLFQYMERDTSRQLPNSGYLTEATSFIHQNYAYNIKVSDIATAVGLERSYLYRIFMSKLNQTPKEYLTSFQLKKARQLLASTDYTITEIAYSCGFKSSSAFYKHFKVAYNMTPKEYISYSSFS